MQANCENRPDSVEVVMSMTEFLWFLQVVYGMQRTVAIRCLDQVRSDRGGACDLDAVAAHAIKEHE